MFLIPASQNWVIVLTTPFNDLDAFYYDSYRYGLCICILCIIGVVKFLSEEFKH